MKRIFIDVDGVLGDWVGRVMEWYNLDITHDDLTHWDAILKHTPCTTEFELFEKINYPYFWEHIRLINPWLINLLDHYNPCILTNPWEGTATWRQNWIQFNLPRVYNAKRYLIGPAKEYVAHKDSYLIDDCERNIECFNKGGGNGILFPQPWNRNRDIKDKVDYVLECIR